MKNLHVRLHSKMKMVHQSWSFAFGGSENFGWKSTGNHQTDAGSCSLKSVAKKSEKLPAHTHTIKERIRNISIHLFSDSNLQYEKCHFPAQCFTKRSLDVYNCSSSSCCCCWWYYYLFFCLFVVCISFIGFLLL